ncbi:MAG: ABC transporter permease [Chitinophagaceae bacterium]|jgi:ABC-2 type transport system permease protein|nr:ABC transporter permease [Chitinophagaceae bacterium]
MNKTFIVAKREFLTRVQKRTFLLTTILLPLLIFGVSATSIYFSTKSGDNLHFAVQDEANVLSETLDKSGEINFEPVQNQSQQALDEALAQKKYDGYIFIPSSFNTSPNDSIQLKSTKSIGLIARAKIENFIGKGLREKTFLSLNITKNQLDSIQNSGNRIAFTTVGGAADSSTKTGASYVVGYASGFLIYMILFFYGMMVMRGVMEEKVSRIAEVIISSVKPFQLMLGKITGIGAVGLLQFFIWIILVIGLQFLLPFIFPNAFQHLQSAPVQTAGMQAAQAVQDSGGINKIFDALHQINLPLILVCFIFYFFGGYFLYASLFAAVGSAVNDDPQDAQSLTLPITMPIIFGFIIMIKAINNPNSSLAVFGSLFPLTSPIVMMARLPQGVSAWELLLSMLFLIIGFIFTTWLAGKIYRTGILMYGKKPTWKELMKWAFVKK